MKMTSKNWLAAIGVVLAGTAFATGFKSDDFEGYATGTPLTGGTNKDWKASSASVVVQTNKAHYGSKAAVVTVSANLSNTVNVSSTKVWSDFWTVPRLYVSDTAAGPAADANATAQFFLNSNGVWATISKEGANIVTNYWPNDLNNADIAYTEAGSNWIHVSVLHDYAQAKWAFFVNGAIVATNLGFINATIPNYNWFNMQNGGGDSAWLDDVTITNRVPAGLQADSDHNGMVDAWEIHFFGALGTTNTASADFDDDGIGNGDESYLSSDPYSVLDPSSPLAASIPWSDSFDATARLNKSLYGQNGWDASPTGNFTVVSMAPATQFKGQAVQMVSGYASHMFGPSPSYTSVWTHLVLKPIPSTETPGTLVSTATVAYYVDTNQTVQAWSNNTWVSLGSIKSAPGGTNEAVFAVDTNAWVRFVTKSDYGSRTWSLYAANVDSGTTSKYARLLGDNLAFNSSASSSLSYQGLFVTNLPDTGATGYLDNVEVTLAMSPWIDTDNDGVPDYFEVEELPAGAETNNAVGETAQFAFGATNAQILAMDILDTNSPSIALSFNVGKDRTYEVIGGTDPNGSFTNVLGSLYTGYSGNNNTFTHTNALNLAGTNRFFYRVRSTSPDGRFTVTNEETYAWYNQPRQRTGTYYWVTAPVDYGTNNTLNGLLGQHLARGLAGDNLPFRADAIQIPAGGTNFIYCYLGSDGVWMTGLVPATNSIPAGTAVLIERRGGGATMSSAVFAGPQQTNAITVTLAAGWNMVGWPYDSSTYNWGLTNGTANSDTIYLLRGSLYQSAVFRTNGTWTLGRTDKGASITTLPPLQPGEGIMYRHTGAPIDWTPARP